MSKTDETQGEYNVQEEVTEAMAMLGQGYVHEPRQIVQEISGFYPLFEVLLERYKDLITPAVFGVAWRYCQMSDGVCKASLRKIAQVLNVDEVTVMRRLKILCDDGYLIDTTPDLRNKPHVYVDAGFVVMKNTLGVTAETASHRKATASQGNSTVSPRKATVSHSQLIKDSNKDSNKERVPPALDFKNMTVGQARKVPTIKLYTDATEFFPASVLWKAVHETITQHKLTFEKLQAAAVAWVGKGHRIQNVEGILEWAVNGVPANGKTSAPPAPARDRDSDYGPLLEMLERQKQEAR
jgi:DNA-binding Lrp family transcriptional regulator